MSQTAILKVPASVYQYRRICRFPGFEQTFLEPLGDVTITLRGTPVQIVERCDLVVLALLAPAAPALDPALPRPPTRTDCLAVLTWAQWTPLARQFSRVRDQVSVTGYPVFDPRHAGITILTSEVHLRKGRTLPARRDLWNWDEDLS